MSDVYATVKKDENNRCHKEYFLGCRRNNVFIMGGRNMKCLTE